TEPRETRDDSGTDPLAVGVDHLRSGRKLHAHSARSDDPSVADHDHSVRYRLRAIAERDGAVDDRISLRTDRCGRGQEQCGNDAPDHFTSPSPGWPSSKSL